MDKKLVKKVITLALPAITSNVLLTAQIFADTIMLGRYHPADVSLSALGLGSILYFLFFPIVIGLLMGSIAIIARRWGEKNYTEARNVATNSLITLLLISVPLSLAGFIFGPYVIYLLGARDLVLIEGTKYIMAIFAFYPFSVCVMTYHHMMIAAGDTKTPMYVNIFMNVYNLIMNLLLIFGSLGFPELGVLGAGIATGTSYLLGVCVYAVLQNRNKLIISPIFKKDVPYNRETVKKLFKIGIPAGIDVGMWSIYSLLITPFIFYFGTVGYSAFQIGIRAESFAYMPALGFGIAAMTLTGQYLGAKKEEKAREVVVIATYLILIWMTIVGLFFILLSKYISMIFTNDPEVIVIAAQYLFIMGFTEPFLGIVFTTAGGMRGAGYTSVPLAINFFGMIVLRLILTYVLAFALGMGLLGIWLSMLIETAIRAMVMYGVFYQGNWMKVKV